jgi:hypothetical protein
MAHKGAFGCGIMLSAGLEDGLELICYGLDGHCSAPVKFTGFIAKTVPFSKDPAREHHLKFIASH